MHVIIDYFLLSKLTFYFRHLTPQLHGNQMDLKYFSLLVPLIFMIQAVTCSVENNSKYIGSFYECYFSIRTDSYGKPLIKFYDSATSNENDAGDKDARLCKLIRIVIYFIATFGNNIKDLCKSTLHNYLFIFFS